ncbi:glucokinase [Kosmotoga arenicorallina S304]|uniref:Glucokinase n=1 Tax=Kosmotoga arenicorallina S304 TaxID=1453497 RepID=A0A176K1I3_9BACT|nr:ROK family glucokinase [Kosmotoga arenicorallina]OAA30834.1 glucokinase [Kosmotoga arenicorallina S304]
MSSYVVGIDLGGTETKIGIIDHDGHIVEKAIIPTQVSKGSNDVIRRIAQKVNELVDEKGMRNDILGIGVGSPGSIDREKGVVIFSPNFQDWKNVPLAEKLEELTGFKAYIENDANAFALGEWAFGKFKGAPNIVALTLGTGVGGGVISRGELITGSKGFGGELGHVIIEPDGPLCGCGSHGCLEALASATSIVRLVIEYRKRYPRSSVFANEEITAKAVFDSAKSGDELAELVVERATRALAVGIAGFVHIFNPNVVIIGGGVSRAGNYLLEKIEKKIKSYVMESFWDTFEIALSELVEDAGIKGAASIVYFRLR